MFSLGPLLVPEDPYAAESSPVAQKGASRGVIQ